MTRRKIFCFAAAALFFLLAAAGCRQDDRALWQILEEQQYNRYKPKLDYMVKKYGDIFEMDVYGTVYCTEPEYKDWSLGVTTGSDNFAVRLRRDELEQFMYKIAQPVLGECKVYVTDGYVSTLGADADIEDFFTYNEQWGVVEYCIYVPYSEDYQTQGKALMDALKGRGYTLSHLDVLFLDEELYEQVDSTLRSGKLPEGYRFRLRSGHYDEWHFSWIENTGLAYMTEKYGDRFQMTLNGTILCTEPEYQDWNIVIDNNTDKEYEDRDNFAIRLHRDELEEILQKIAEPVFGECKVYVTGGRCSELGPDAAAEDFLTYKRVKWPYDMRLPHALVSCCVCVPYREDYKTSGEALMPKVLEQGYLPFKITILFLDPEQYEQADRAGAVQLTGRDEREGYRARLLTQCNGDFEPEIERYWNEAE